MKKTYLAVLGVLVMGFGLLTAFSDDSMTPEQKEQLLQIDDMLNSQLDSFRLVKEGECDARALEVAIARADSIMSAKPKTVTKPRRKAAPKPAPKTEKEIITEKKKSKMQGKTPTKEETLNKKKSKMKGKN